MTSSPPRQPPPLRPDQVPEDVPEEYPQLDESGYPEPAVFPDRPDEPGPDEAADIPPD